MARKLATVTASTKCSSFGYVTGNFRDTIDFDTGAGTSNLISAGSYDIFSNFVWAKAMGGTSADYIIVPS